MTSQHTISSITKYTRYHHKACILSLKQQNLKTLIDVARYKSLIEQSYSFTIRYFDWSDSFCDLVTWPTIISDDTLAFLFNKCNMDCCSFYQKFMSNLFHWMSLIIYLSLSYIVYIVHIFLCFSITYVYGDNNKYIVVIVLLKSSK
jgi:hypothetical protein